MILLDTSTFLWLAEGSPRISAEAAKILQDTTFIFVSSISAFEIGQKHAQGKLGLRLPPLDWFQQVRLGQQFRVLPLIPEHSLSAGALPPLPKDPIDRLLIGSALPERLVLLTPDPLIRQYTVVQTRW